MWLDDPSRFFLIVAGLLIVVGFCIAAWIEHRHQNQRRREDRDRAWRYREKEAREGRRIDAWE